jgi:hypothetical protein
MLRKMALIAMAAGSLFAVLPTGQADARPGVYVGRGHSVYASPVHFRHHYHRHHHYRPYFYTRYAFPVYSYAYTSSYGDGCYWLKRRAIHTGSAYWWHRYRDCRGY